MKKQIANFEDEKAAEALTSSASASSATAEAATEAAKAKATAEAIHVVRTLELLKMRKGVIWIFQMSGTGGM